MHSCEHNNRVKRRKSRKDIENTKKIWRLSGWKCIQNSMHGLWANLKRRGSCFCVIQGRKLSSFRSSAKAAGAKISVYTKILHFQQKSQWGTSWENTRVLLFQLPPSIESIEWMRRQEQHFLLGNKYSHSVQLGRGLMVLITETRYRFMFHSRKIYHLTLGEVNPSIY